MVITSCSPALLVTVQSRRRRRRRPRRSVHGGLIQFSGLYARSSAWTDTEPSALTRSSRVRHRQVGGEPADVVDAAPSDDQTHPGTLACDGGAAAAGPADSAARTTTSSSGPAAPGASWRTGSPRPAARCSCSRRAATTGGSTRSPSRRRSRTCSRPSTTGTTDRRAEARARAADVLAAGQGCSAGRRSINAQLYVRGQPARLRHLAGRARLHRLGLRGPAAVLPARRGQRARRVGLPRGRRAAAGGGPALHARAVPRVRRVGGRVRHRAQRGLQRRRARTAPASSR